MTILIIMISLVVLSQIGIFFYSRKLKKAHRKHVLTRYKITSAREAWQVLQDPDLPEADRLEIEKIYEGKD